jgi:two-component system, chemotaxis family, chemotaxis protein CheY
MRILIIDDDEHARSFAVKALTLAGHAVTVQADGTGLGEALATQTPDLVMTDLFMPNVDGFESIRTLTARWPQVAVLAVTGGGPGSLGTPGTYLTMARALGVDAALAKPYTIDELISSIADAVAERDARMNNRRGE